MTDYTPTYRVDFKASGGGVYTAHAWDVRYDGRPTDANLARWAERFETATWPGGCNAHLGRTVVWSARITHQRSYTVVASYRGPSFAVVD